GAEAWGPYQARPKKFVAFGLSISNSLPRFGMARGLGIAGVLGAWLLQSLYLAVCWSYFAYFGLHLMFATALSVGTEGMTAVGHGAIPLIVGMLWLLIDLPFVFAWCVADGGRWRWSAVAGVAQL